MLSLFEESGFTFRFTEPRIIPRIHLEGVAAGRSVSVFRLDAVTGQGLGLLANAIAGQGGWVDLPVPIVVRAGEGFVAVPGTHSSPGTGAATVRNIIFDLDGTLLDSRPGIVASLRHALEQLGHTWPADSSLDWAIGPPVAEVFSRLLAPFGDTRVEEGVALYRKRYGDSGLHDARVFHGVPVLLARLKESGKALFVATAKRVDFARKVLAHFDLAPFFHAAYGPGLDGSHARKADLVTHLLKVEGLDPSVSVLVGDRDQDVTAARANNLRVVAVTWGYGSRDELAEADLLCDKPDELSGLAAAG